MFWTLLKNITLIVVLFKTSHEPMVGFNEVHKFFSRKD